MGYQRFDNKFTALFCHDFHCQKASCNSMLRLINVPLTFAWKRQDNYDNIAVWWNEFNIEWFRRERKGSRQWSGSCFNFDRKRSTTLLLFCRVMRTHFKKSRKARSAPHLNSWLVFPLPRLQEVATDISEQTPWVTFIIISLIFGFCSWREKLACFAMLLEVMAETRQLFRHSELW